MGLDSKRRRVVRVLRPEEVTAIAFVDKGANPEARITFFKRDGAQGADMPDITLREACERRIFAIGDEIRKQHPELTREQAVDKAMTSEDGAWLRAWSQLPEAELPAHEAVMKIAQRLQAGDIRVKKSMLARLGV